MALLWRQIHAFKSGFLKKIFRIHLEASKRGFCNELWRNFYSLKTWIFGTLKMSFQNIFKRDLSKDQKRRFKKTCTVWPILRPFYVDF